MALPMAIVGPVLGMGSLIMITASAIVMIRRLAPKVPKDASDRNALLDDVHSRLDELDELRNRVNELEERLDFAERVLLKQREAPRLGSPQAGSE
jgi:predicted nuclease with TOPRIM domain